VALLAVSMGSTNRDANMNEKNDYKIHSLSGRALKMAFFHYKYDKLLPCFLKNWQ
jgi:hypothetical protein